MKHFVVVTAFALSVFLHQAQAQVPCIDPAGVAQNVTETGKIASGAATTAETLSTKTKMMAKLGSAKESISGYMDKINKFKEEKLAKLEEQKKKVEDFIAKKKAKYEEIKGKVEKGVNTAKDAKAEVESGINKAKDIKEEVESGINTAKDIKDGVLGGGDSGDDTSSDVSEEVIEPTTSSSTRTPFVKEEGTSSDTLRTGVVAAVIASPQSQAAGQPVKPAPIAAVIASPQSQVAGQPAKPAPIAAVIASPQSKVAGQPAKPAPIAAVIASPQSQAAGQPSGTGIKTSPQGTMREPVVSVAPPKAPAQLSETSLKISPQRTTSGPVVSVAPPKAPAQLSKTGLKISPQGTTREPVVSVAPPMKSVTDQNKKLVPQADAKIESSPTIEGRAAPALDVKEAPAKSQGVLAPIRKMFKISQNKMQLRTSSPLAFASLSDIQTGTTEENVMIVPEAISLECDIDYEKASQDENYDKCLRQINTVRKSEVTKSISKDQINDAENNIQNGYVEMLAAGYLEGMEIYNESLNFKNDIADHISTTKSDDVDSAWHIAKEAHQEVGNRLSILNKIWARKLATQSLGEYVVRGIKHAD